MRAAVAGGVDGDDLEAEVDEARQGLGVEEALGREAVDDDERHAPPADRDADLVAVGERDLVPGQPRQGDVDLLVALEPGPMSGSLGDGEVAHRRPGLGARRRRIVVRRVGPRSVPSPSPMRHGPSLADRGTAVPDMGVRDGQPASGAAGRLRASSQSRPICSTSVVDGVELHLAPETRTNRTRTGSP